MKILFSNAPWWDDAKTNLKIGIRAGSRWPFMTNISRNYKNFNNYTYLPYPFFMGYAASYIKKKCKTHDIYFRDSVALRDSYYEYFKYIKDNNFDYIFFETSTPSLEHDISIIKEIYSKNLNSKIVLVGPNIYKNGKQLLSDYSFIHSCICGEYEIGAYKVISGEQGFIDYNIMSLDEMNSSPFPYMDNTYTHLYRDSGILGGIMPHIQLFSSRGCPYKCVFCVWPATMTGNDPDGTKTRKVRFYSKEYLNEYLRLMIKTYNFKAIYFDDDTFNLNDSHVLNVCDLMKNIKLPWAAMCRADTIKKETWREMRDSGCVGVKMGFESGNQWVIDNIINKKLNLEEAKEMCLYLLKGLKIRVHGTFTIGLPGETESQMNDTKNFIKSIPFTSYQLSGCGVMGGTPLDNIIEGGSLNNYPGANSNNFINESDGGKKLELIKEKCKI